MWAQWEPLGLAQDAACRCLPQLSHDTNETLALHLYVKSHGKSVDSKLQGTRGRRGGMGPQWGESCRRGVWRRSGRPPGAQLWVVTASCPLSAVTLYNCSFARNDCSLCLAADPAYRCVWCAGQNRCVYEAQCSNATSECPPPVITRVSPSPSVLPGRSGGPAGPAVPSCPQHQQLAGLCCCRSSPKQARWVAASASPSLGPTWASPQTTCRG